MPELSHFVQLIISMIGYLQYPGLFLVVCLEYACFPLPSEIILPFIGMSIPQTSLQFFPSFIVSILAGICGSSICYLIGFYGGAPLLNKWSKKSKNIRKATTKFNTWFNDYGCWAVLLARIVPLTRTYISLFAGINKMSLFDFFLYSIVGITFWNLALISLGLYLGNNWALIQSLLNTYSKIIILILTLGGLFLIYKHKKSVSSKL